MTRSASTSSFALKSLGIVLLVGMGQFWMVRQDQDWTLWPALFFFALAVALLWKTLPEQALTASSSISFKIESFLFTAILALGFFLRVHGINQFPDGIFSDRGEVACQALRILHDGWRPGLETLHFHIAEWPIYYLVAGWFWLFGGRPEVYAYFDVALSTAGILLTYLAFRQVLEVRACLFGFFLLAVMRWNFVFAHQVYFQSETVFFLFLTLALFLYGFRKKSSLAVAAAGLVLAGGLYSYQSLKIAPLLFILFLVFDRPWKKGKPSEDKKIWAVFGGSFLAGILPLAIWMIRNGEVGRREMEVSIFSSSQGNDYHGFLAALFQNFKYLFLLLFDRFGTFNAQTDFQDHRMLDDVTGPLFILSLFYMLRRKTLKPFFYMLVGMAVMCLPGLLSIYGGNTGRLLGMTPFMAYGCGLLLSDWVKGFEREGAEKKNSPWIWRVVLGVLLLIATGQNYYDYFYRETSDPACQNDFSWSETKVGRLMAQAPAGCEFFLPPIFAQSPTVGYLTYPNWGHFHVLDLSKPPRSQDFPTGTSFYFFEDELKMGSMDLLKRLYPSLQVASWANPLGEVKVYSGFVGAESLARSNKPVGIQRGLLGEYRHIEKGPVFLTRLDPLINFSYSDLPQIGTPLFIHWSGSLEVTQPGSYDLWVLTLRNGRARLVVDGKDSGQPKADLKEVIVLNKGIHHLEIFVQQDPVPFGVVDLFWKKPGEMNYSLVPNEVWARSSQQ